MVYCCSPVGEITEFQKSMAPVPPQYDVIIVGAGILGLYTAYTMVRKGLKVLLLDQFQLPHKRGSSGDASRIIRLYYKEEQYVRMTAEAYKTWQELERTTGEELLQVTGALSIHEGEANIKILDATSKIMTQFDLAHTVLTSEEIKQRFPMLNVSADCKALIDLNAGCLVAVRCIRVLLSEFLKLGGKLNDAEKVMEVTPGRTVTVVTSKGQYKARNVVLSQGPWAEDLLKSLGLNIPLNILPATVCYWKEKVTGSHSHSAEMPVFVHNLNVPQGYQFVYGFPSMEYPGLIKVATRGEPALSPCDPDGRDKDVEGRDRIINQLKHYIKECIPGIDHTSPAIIEGCMYTRTLDGDFIIDRHPKHANILIATGGSGHAFKMAPVIGKLLTEMATGSATSYDMTRFKITRFKPAAKI